MKHSAWIVTAGDNPAARIGTPVLLPALRRAALSCCDEVCEVTAQEVSERLAAKAADEVILLLDAAMPLVGAGDMRCLMAEAVARGGVSCAMGGSPRAVYRQAGPSALVDLPEASLWYVHDPVTLAEALAIARRRKANALMAAGVYLLDPATTCIDPAVQIGEGTVVHSNCMLSGETVIGRDCVLLPGCRVEASQIGDRARVEQSTIIESAIGEDTTVGPYAVVRAGTRVGKGCRIGNFVEIKNSTLGDGACAAHLAYVGDADVGRRVNLGCGIVFVNYDGKEKHRTTVEDDAFIGCNVNLVSPVHIGRDAYIAAGSTVTEDVPEGAFAIARQRQTTKEGWVQKRREKDRL